MEKQKFFDSFLRHPYSSIRIKDLIRCIESYEDSVIPFTIEDAWSWRWVYADPCLKVNLCDSTKSDLLKEIDYLLNTTFEGWKGGDYEYDVVSLLHFEEDPSQFTTIKDSCVGYKLFEDNQDNPFIRHIIKYFENDEHLKGNDEVFDYSNHIINKGDEIVFDYDDKLVIGKVANIINGKLTIHYDDYTVSNVSPNRTILKRYIEFK